MSRDRTRRDADRIDVRKTYKLYVGGAFPRSESARSYEVTDARGGFLANASLASRKDGRDAVVAARKAFGSWSARTPYNRGQVVYRIAEVLESRRDQLEREVREATGVNAAGARAEVDQAVDRLVWYAGWADKLAQVVGNANPVAGPYFNLSSPEPTGVVAVLAPASPLLGLVSVVAPVITTGNTCVVVASQPHPLPAITLAEVMATADLPGGVVNVLTGHQGEIAPWLASHLDVDGLDLTGVDDVDLARDLEVAAADNLKRVRRPGPEDLAADPRLDRMTRFVETKTVWHPVGT
ncbi:NAD/NADP-dependent betaine aldehyde dehydrogenase [Nocardioides aquaticus]|jgi:acyl-CoA reductase-like NAD-dependent aldehyde dehydrogenase|uniref:NAD/NADP-dependent betaine aldehyde dehydrogenase n=1 Tax=Nocardioides aquaticus TaxID=160826 RepID=A0ABX8EEW5_9ACTN|nr:aldehyde dehydrogenase family protein [Nocardioides aquaticus]QVT78836.1 NAD/NADP-dependent betaine aldehyde dehydrogenase [Nocardioides aquaticus]